jgi:hypothetical protein
MMEVVSVPDPFVTVHASLGGASESVLEASPKPKGLPVTGGATATAKLPPTEAQRRPAPDQVSLVPS